jgi:transcriptional regulator GlxA family with amidase domain
MRARSDEPLSMGAVAREIGVGLRSLQLAFLEVRALGPRDVLMQMRLDRAHERLLAAGPSDSVTSIALECSFAHLGRFPAAYRSAFGELPAETLARSRRRPL